MTKSFLDYDAILSKALHGALRHILHRIGTQGFQGSHHCYIAFQTQAAGVSISSRLAKMYPDQMRIVLQHQFWDLQTDDDGFSVVVQFSGVPEKLVIPYAAVSEFSDPAVGFTIHFTHGTGLAETSNPGATSLKDQPAPTASKDNTLVLMASKKPQTKQKPQPTTQSTSTKKSIGGVVSLADFRDKKPSTKLS